MNNEPQTSTNQTAPTWFADNTNTKPSTPTPSGLNKRLPLIIGALLVIAVLGVVAWYISTANAAKASAFQSFQGTYESLETELIDFDDITEPENLNTDSLNAHWDAYLSALNGLPKTPLYTDNISLIESIRAKSMAYERYVTKVLPSLNQFLGSCLSMGDETMYSLTCRGYIQAAIYADDPLTKGDLQALLSLLVQMAQTNNLTETQTDAVRELVEKLFSVGATLQTAVRPSMVELGKKVGVDVQATNL